MAMPNNPLQSPSWDGTTWVQRSLNASRHRVNRLQIRLGKRGLIIVGMAVIAGGLALNWSWLVAIGLAPLLLTVLPCAAMCALGVCMITKNEKPMGGGPMTTVSDADDSGPTIVGSQSDRNL